MVLAAKGGAQESASLVLSAFRETQEQLELRNAKVNCRKTLLLGSTPAVRAVLAAEREEGEPSVQSTAKDLGVDVQWAGPARHTLRARGKVMSSRADRVAALPLGRQHRQHLCGALLLPGGLYGCEATGCSLAELTALRRAVHAGLEGGAPGRRAVESDLCLTLKPERVDPVHAVVCTTLRSWAAHLREDPGLAARAAHQWGRVAAGGGAQEGLSPRASRPSA